MRRVWHNARVRKLDVLKPDEPWEVGSGGRRTARPFGGASIIDPRDGLLRLFYRCGWRGAKGRTCIALSRDGVRFFKPALRMHMHKNLPSNIVIESKHVETFEVTYDPYAPADTRWWALRMEFMTGGSRFGAYVQYESPDGLHWTKRPQQNASDAQLVMADRSTFFLNPLREPPMWVFSLRENLCVGGPSGHMRARRYWERPRGARFASQGYKRFLRTYFQCEHWQPGEPVPWFGVDKHDCSYGECDVYNVDGIAYESLILHGLAVLHGPNHGGELKNNSAHLGFSRDGFHSAYTCAPNTHVPRAHASVAPHGATYIRLLRTHLSHASAATSAPICARARPYTRATPVRERRRRPDESSIVAARSRGDESLQCAAGERLTHCVTPG